MTCYPTPVEKLTDEELEVLSAELESAYSETDEDGYASWENEDAARRYREMDSEIHRRFMLANPDWKPSPPPPEFTKMVLNTLAKSIGLSRKVSASFDSHFAPKIGDTIHVRKPASFRA